MGLTCHIYTIDFITGDKKNSHSSNDTHTHTYKTLTKGCSEYTLRARSWQTVRNKIFEQTWNTLKKTKTDEITQDFYQTMPINNMKGKDRIVMTRLRTRHCKLTHEYLLKRKNRTTNV